MCRLAGFWDMRPERNYNLQATLLQMRDSLTHGGPDAAGHFLDAEQGLGLGHRRLSILDLSPAGQQPMAWRGQQIIFNGEIYNFQAIRQELEAQQYSFSTGTDTEVILRALDYWGLDALQRFRGMFAFALWDEQEKRLRIYRDRLGVKPLYWYWKDGLLLFASELKAFHQHPHFDKSISKEALSLFLQQGYIPQPYCIFRHAQKLPSGCMLEIDARQQPEIRRYWSVEEVYEKGGGVEKSEAEWLKDTEAVLSEAFQLRLVADVPVGVFLSGGFDSTLVTALLQKQHQQPLQSFTIGFENPAYNEAEHAKAVAQHLGTEHHELYCTEQDFKALVPQFVDMYDEPFGDSSGIPTYLVAKMARDKVTVALSADGGDELFGGYTKYEVVSRFYPKIQRFPKLLRKGIAGAAGLISPHWLERNASRLPILKNYSNVAAKYPKLLNALRAEDAIDFFQRASCFLSPKEQQRLLTHYEPRQKPQVALDPQRSIGYWGMLDMQTYLEGDIMCKVDRATMQVALEGREPFLDPKVIELAMQLPDEFKIRGKETKYILRQILYKYVPKKLMDRPKQGFAIPLEEWLRGFLRPELEALCEDKSFYQNIPLQQAAVRKRVQGFLQQKTYVHPYSVWFLYVLYAWQRRWMA